MPSNKKNKRHSREKKSLLGNENITENNENENHHDNNENNDLPNEQQEEEKTQEQQEEQKKSIADNLQEQLKFYAQEDQEEEDEEEEEQTFTRGKSESQGDQRQNEKQDQDQDNQQEEETKKEEEEESIYQVDVNEDKEKKRNILQYYVLPEKVENIVITEYLEVSPSILDFGRMYTGSHIEKEFDLQNLSTENIVVNISIENTYGGALQIREYNNNSINDRIDLNEQQQQQQENVQVLIAGQSFTSLKIMLIGQKISESQVIKTNLQFQLEGFEDSSKTSWDRTMNIPILGVQAQPKLVCPKAMTFKGMKVIKAACKLSVPQTEIRVGFQISDYSSVIEIEFLDDQPNDFLNIRSRPLQAVVDYNGGFLINMVMRPNYLNIIKKGVKEVSKVLLLKLKNTSIIYSFPLIIEVC